MDKQTARNRVFFVSAKEVLQYRSSLGKEDQDEGKRGEKRGEGEGGGRVGEGRGEGRGGKGEGGRERGEGREKREGGGIRESERKRARVGRQKGGERKRIEGRIAIASVVLSGIVLSFH